MNRKGATGLLAILLAAALLAGCAQPEESGGPEAEDADNRTADGTPGEERVSNDLPAEPTIGERTAEDVERAV